MGLVGPGFVGAHHVDAVRRLGFVDVVAICDVTQEDAEAKAAALGVPKAYGAVEALAADPDIHIVHVTTPNAQHGHGVRAALAAGKHVLCEKPLAMSSDEAWSLWQAARAAGVVHAVMFNYRGNAMVQEARAMVASGELGRSTSCTAPTSRTGCSSPPTSRGGCSPSTADPAWRSPTSARTGWTWCSTSWGAASRPCLPI